MVKYEEEEKEKLKKEEKEKKKEKKKKDKKKGNEQDDNKEEPKEEVIQEEKPDKPEEAVKQHDSKLGVDHYEKDNWDENEFTWREQPLKPGYARPVMVHRAILGSVERFFAILTEHTGGNWPFWLSPRQIMICPISEKSLTYAERITNRLLYESYKTDLNRTNKTINKKISMAELEHYHSIIVVGKHKNKFQVKRKKS